MSQWKASSSTAHEDRKTRCKNCKGCQRPDCGKCKSCKSMTKFGGAGMHKQACLFRVCDRNGTPSGTALPPTKGKTQILSRQKSRNIEAKVKIKPKVAAKLKVKIVFAPKKIGSSSMKTVPKSKSNLHGRKKDSRQKTDFVTVKPVTNILVSQKVSKNGTKPSSVKNKVAEKSKCEISKKGTHKSTVQSQATKILGSCKTASQEMPLNAKSGAIPTRNDGENKELNVKECGKIPICTDGKGSVSSALAKVVPSTRTSRSRRISEVSKSVAASQVTTATSSSQTGPDSCTKSLGTKVQATQVPSGGAKAGQVGATQSPATPLPSGGAKAGQVGATQSPATPLPSGGAKAGQVGATQSPATNVPAARGPSGGAKAGQVGATQSPATKVPAARGPSGGAKTGQVVATQSPAVKVPAARGPSGGSKAGQESVGHAGDASFPASPMTIREFPKGLYFPYVAEIYICYFCEKEFVIKEKMRQHQKICAERPPTLDKYQLSVCIPTSKSSPSPPTISPKCPQHNYPKVPVGSFVRHLNLIPKQAAARLRAHRPSLAIDCNIEELEALPVVTPVTPATPCSPPMSLMSQLSREEPSRVARKRLSYSLSVDRDREKDKDRDKEKDKDKLLIEEMGEDADSSDSDEEDTTGSAGKQMNLLNIPISSLLGQRVQKYMHVDAPVAVVENSASFCKTPVKNTFLDKLRRKSPHYPYVYRPRQIAHLHRQNHAYKFTKADVKEFMERLATGLNHESRQKMKLLRKFRIRLSRMTEQQLLKWVPKRVLDRQLYHIYREKSSDNDEDEECQFPQGPTLLIPKIDKILGLKKRSSQESQNALSVGHFVSEEMEAEMSKQKLTLYRSLLYELSVLTPTVVMTDISPSSSSQNSARSAKGKKLPVSSKQLPVSSKQLPVSNSMSRVKNKSKNETGENTEGTSSEYQTMRKLLTMPVENMVGEEAHSSNVLKSKAEPHRECCKTPDKLSRAGLYESASPYVSCAKQRGQNGNLDNILMDKSQSIAQTSSTTPFTSDDDISSCRNCCVQYPNKEHVSVSQDNCVCKETFPSSSSVGDILTAVEPLTVMVDRNLPQDSNFNTIPYEIPSPVSITTESPSVCTPSKGFPPVQMSEDESEMDLDKPFAMNLLTRTSMLLSPSVETEEDPDLSKSGLLVLQTRAKSYPSNGSVTPTKSYPSNGSVTPTKSLSPCSTASSSPGAAMPTRTRSCSGFAQSGPNGPEQNLKPRSRYSSVSLPNTPEKRSYNRTDLVSDESNVLGIRTRRSLQLKENKTVNLSVEKTLRSSKSGSLVVEPAKKLLEAQCNILEIGSASPTRRSKRLGSLPVGVAGTPVKLKKLATNP